MTPPNTTGAQALSDEQLTAMVEAAGGDVLHENATASMPGDFVFKLDADALRNLLAGREQAGAVAPRWIIARQTVIDDLPGSRPLRGYTVFADPFTTFETAEQASEALQELKLPLGWVRMMTDQEPWASLFPPVWSQAAIAAREEDETPKTLDDALYKICRLHDALAIATNTIESRGRRVEELKAALASRDEAPAASAQQRFCNKCGYYGPDVQHERPNGSGRCGYLSRATAPEQSAKGLTMGGEEAK